jgi:ferredoxin
MTCTITDKCISCEVCLTQCPTGAIAKINGTFSINPNLCNDCVGFYGVPQCIAICPTSGGCVPSVASLIDSFKVTTNYWDKWFATYSGLLKRMQARQNSKYWQRWFDIYSQKLQVISH